MAPRFNHKAGEVFGSWKLLEQLDAGGNAEVWRASNGDGRNVALKILYQKNPDSEPYKRFKAEIEFLRSLGEQPGVLAIIEASLPQQLSKKNPAWFAMPIATPITEALGNSPDIQTVVEAVSAIAETLTFLAEKKVSHRDIKPGNLYSFEGRWTIGDFGLVSYPDKEALTAEGKTLGPQHFMAPEMISNPRHADGTKADVYSLAKTLWVLATGQNYPPPGEQRMDVEQISLGAYVSDSRVRFLDSLIERATRIDPELRPSMSDMARELRAWLSPVTKSANSADVSDLIERIAVATAASSHTRQLQLHQRKEASNYVERFRPTIESLAIEIQKTGWADEQITRTDHIFLFYPGLRYGFELSERDKQHEPAEYVIYSDGIAIFAQGPGRYPVRMVCGIQANLYEDGVLEFAGGYDFLAPWVPSSIPDLRWIGVSHAPSGSVLLEQHFRGLRDGIIKSLRPALEHFARMIEASI